MTEAGIKMLKGHEGLRLVAYKCPAGKLTIGYGHTNKVKEGDTCTITEAEAFLLYDIAVAEKDAQLLIKHFPSLTPRRQDAITNLALNLGRTKLAKFTTTLNYIRTGKFAAAANSLAHTKWAKDVGKHRSGDIITAIREG
ncbi:MAG: lysozyme [Patescibacteria group bacterium]